jgi:hypothetical protein
MADRQPWQILDRPLHPSWRAGRIIVWAVLASVHPTMNATAQQPPARPARQARPTPPTRDPSTPGFVSAKELPDGAVPPADADGNFIIGPTHNRAPEMTAQDGVPTRASHERQAHLERSIRTTRPGSW